MSRDPETATSLNSSFRLGEWLVEPSLNRVSRGDTTIQLELKVMDVLVCLAERAGEVVTRFEIIDRVWATEFIADNTLTHAINEIRTALGDDARNPSFIETIHRRGYRLMVPVELEEPPAGTVAQFPSRSRVVGDDDRSPYPGLAAFTEADAEFFFGREAEVALMWRKLMSRRLLAVIGPSGVGKSSLLRAGVIPAKPDGWGVLICQPGEAPFAALARTLAPEFKDDVDAIAQLIDIRESATRLVTRWRERHDQVLVIVDQFEELFTLNPPETQRQFAELVGRLAREADVHVLLSLRDDFLFRCHDHEPLTPVFDALTPVKAPGAHALFRALVEPAARRGFTFEDDELPREMVSEVEGERGALPMLAFAVARLWAKRDRKRRLMTRQASTDIGGVSGSLARHAEATLQGIGGDRLPIVREIFRNLVTAEGTRTVREWDELLSIFDPVHPRAEIKPVPTNAGKTVGEGFIPSRAAAEEVLRQLIDARLLTSYEVREEDHDPTRRIEIIHESLLANWPRLVRWQTQDQDGAQLRDELRQAARAWDDHDRQDDRLWTGTAFREYRLWRERYPGGLTDLEEAFAAAMISFATRRKRRRRIAAGVGAAVLLAVLAVVTGLWRHSVQQTRLAEAEADRAEASKLLTLGESAFADGRTTALAYTIAALERSDTPEARRLALKALWVGPPATLVPETGGSWGLAFAPDGRHLAVGYRRGKVQVFPQDGGEPVQLEGFEPDKGIAGLVSFSTDASLLIGSASVSLGEVRIWETRTWQTERVLQVPGVEFALGLFEPGGTTAVTVGFQYDGPGAAPSERHGTWIVHRWPAGDASPQLVGAVAGTQSPYAVPDPRRGLMLIGRRDTVRLHRLETLGREPGRVIARHPEVFAVNSWPAIDPTDDQVALADAGGNLLFWPLDGDGHRPERTIVETGEPSWTAFSSDGSLLAQVSGKKGARVWDLRGWGGAEPLGFGGAIEAVFSPDNRWLATSGGGVALFPLTGRYCRVLRAPEQHAIANAKFSPDGSTLFTQGGGDGTVLSWDLSAGPGIEPTTLYQKTPQWGWGLAVDPRGRFLVVGFLDGTWKVPLDGSDPTELDYVVQADAVLGPEGRLLATNLWNEGRTSTMVVLDLETGQRWQFDPPGEGWVNSWGFDPAGKLLMARGGVLSSWDAASGVFETVVDEGVRDFEISQDGRRRLLFRQDYSFELQDLEQDLRTRFAAPANISSFYIDPSGTLLLVGTQDGEIQIGSILGGEPHLLLGHEGAVSTIDVSPDGRWIVSRAQDKTVRLWPMPDLSKPPLQTLPHDELMTKLKALTNFRAVPDPESITGYTTRPDPTAYHGWETVPEW